MGTNANSSSMPESRLHNAVDEMRARRAQLLGTPGWAGFGFMKAIKKPKQPNPNGRPLPSRFARTFFDRRTHAGVIHDFYGTPYVVMADGSIRRK